MNFLNMNELVDFCNKNKIKYLIDEPLALHTTFKIGGKCKIMVFPSSANAIGNISGVCKKLDIKTQIIGNGSNLLATDNGFDGCVILLGKEFSKIQLIDKDTIYAQSGATISSLCQFALENSLSGLEFAWGIPATVGGAIYMNAGAYGGEIKDVLQSTEHLDTTGTIKTMEIDTLQMEYRHSYYSNKEEIILSGTFKLKTGDKTLIKETMTNIFNRRKTKQPLEFPSAGSTFKRPEGAYAAALIEECGLKGVSVGGAEVSQKHAGFIINKSNATCKDVLSLVELVQNTVKEKTGYKLHREVLIIGD